MSCVVGVTQHTPNSDCTKVGTGYRQLGDRHRPVVTTGGGEGGGDGGDVPVDDWTTSHVAAAGGEDVPDGDRSSDASWLL